MAGIYIHVPFCKQKCHYCAFHFSTTYHSYRNEMLAALEKELFLSKNLVTEPIASIYFGGGTPSLLTTDEIANLLNCIQIHFSIEPEVEITLETNPDDITKEQLNNWFNLGINRLSIGVQSFNEVDLKTMNRAHSKEQAHNALELIKKSSFNNYSVDLMFALPHLSNENWLNNLQTLVSYEIPHISCYNLTVEEQTALLKLIHQAKIPPVSEDKGNEQFEMVMDFLTQHGYNHYEISNYSKPGFESKHNSAYWEGKNYLGIGPSAHSLINSDRLSNISHNTQYIKAIQGNELPRKTEKLTQKNRFNELILTRLRTAKGLDISLLEKEFPMLFLSIQPALKTQLNLGNVILQENHLTLTRQGKFIADSIALELFTQ